jgi:hypothetical protein
MLPWIKLTGGMVGYRYSLALGHDHAQAFCTGARQNEIRQTLDTNSGDNYEQNLKQPHDQILWYCVCGYCCWFGRRISTRTINCNL